jgi:hypothetical protein
MEQLLTRDLDGFEVKTYEDRRLPIDGIGPEHLPFIDMEPYLDTSTFHEFHDEINMGLSRIRTYGFPNVSGTIPEELREFDGQTHPLNMLYHIEQYDPDGRHRRNLAKLESQEERVKYCTFAMGAAQGWSFSVFLLMNDYLTRQDPSKIRETSYSNHFQQTIQYIRNCLPYKYVSRAILFTTFPGTELTCHRDFYGSGHSDHHICFNFGPGRRAYVYDCDEQERVHVREGCRAYFFNDRDYHGVSPVPEFTYTIRVDGQFTDEFSEQIGLIDGQVCGY